MQVKDCLKQNEELRSMLDKLRIESIMNNENHIHSGISESNKEGEAHTTELVSLKVTHIIIHL